MDKKFSVESPGKLTYQSITSVKTGTLLASVFEVSALAGSRYDANGGVFVLHNLWLPDLFTNCAGLSEAHIPPNSYISFCTHFAGRHKCRELWPSDVYEKGFNLYLDSVLLVLPLLIMTVVYAIITRTLCLGIRLEHRSVALGIPLKSPYREKGSANSPGSKAETPPGREEATCMVTTTSETTSSRTLGRSANGVRCQSVLVRGVNADKNQAAMVRVIRMLFVVVVEFFVCWTPLYVVHTWSLYDPDAVYDWLGSAGVSVVHLLAYASSCSNPITYCFMHQKFRQGFLSAVGCRRNSSCCGHAGSWLARQCSAREASMASGTTFVYQDAAKKRFILYKPKIWQKLTISPASGQPLLIRVRDALSYVAKELQRNRNELHIQATWRATLRCKSSFQ
ncbi:hypothetical protein HPB48_011403 [Haemaphysalis longicornis]|uniref:G-protein coupled receptors family 1 profile domain-containing protein n=1 Tax=Haemaphysalis longicornis TaxID=44386 RepID=A0A9J6GFT1_HAELO|nr:hypothetical protein HPB48_011403 [Haemaphysalis longicornis]